MNIIVALLLGLVGGGVGFGLGIVIGEALVKALSIPSREGEAGYFVVFVALATALVSLIGSILITLRWRGVRTLSGLALHSTGTLLALAGVVTAGFLIHYYGSERPLSPNGAPPRLVFQIRTPPDWQFPETGRVYAELHSPKYRPQSDVQPGTRQPDGRLLLEGEVEIYSRTPDRTLVLWLPGATELPSFPVRLPANPTGARHRDWSQWSQEMGDYQFRYRVVPVN